ncbi:TPA: hypothetical protein ACPFE4_000673 [Staphylococcus aureus]|nr:hypothetical protein [Staphylococcus aureus]MDU9989226.1 hypothetical protein [Staphylococcus aureus]MDU9991826.1 hypothetical protein [Staphylococcus aureus]MDU9995759.1 hypothetical protein [Staphylococcus aureus]MDV0053720.1 hypothetical protein [Staphylococcus aureus]
MSNNTILGVASAIKLYPWWVIYIILYDGHSLFDETSFTLIA